MLITNKYEIPAKNGRIFVYEYYNCLYAAIYLTEKINYHTSLYAKEEEAIQEIIILHTKYSGVTIHATS